MDNSEARFEFKCRRCGALNYNPCCSETMAQSLLIEIAVTGKGGNSQTGGTINMHSIHRCEDGGMGISDIQGYKMFD